MQCGIKRGESQQRLNHKGTKDTKQKRAKFPAVGIADLDRRVS
jgi:hypothetical protein